MGFVLYGVLVCFCLFYLQNASCQNTTNLNRNRRQIGDSGLSCELPPHPKNGRWTVLRGDGRPGYHITKDSVLKFECDPDYKLSSRSPLMVCDAHWSLSKVPTCEKKCSPKYSSPTTILKCEDKYGREVSCDEAVDGTYLTYNCIPFYETPLGYKKTILCVEGTWNFPNPVCQPVCGKKIEKDNIKLIVGGIKKDKREYPWIIALYQKVDGQYENVCGGSLVSQRVVITAGHCVTNNYGDPLAPDQFMLGIGKYYTKYNDSRDVDVQYAEIARIVVQPGFKGASQHFLADLALLISKELIVLSEVVQPVCYQDLASIHLQAGKIGVVAGWGTTQSGEQPDELRTLEIPYKYETTCSQELPTDWAERYNTNDKICAGFLNQNKSVCTGDSGSGLYFQNPEDNRYYIHGVVSIAPADKGACDTQQNSLYTKVVQYYEFVDRETTRQYVEQCSLPSYPNNGKWVITDQSKKPGDIVASNTVLKVECNQGYGLSSNIEYIDCESAYAMPKCELLCPKLELPEGTTYICNNIKDEEIDCSKSVHGSTLTYSCPEGYRLPPRGNKVKFCKNGSWGRHNPQCVVDPESDVVLASEKKVVCIYDGLSAHKGILPKHFDPSLCTHLIYGFIGLWESGDVRVQEDALELDNGDKKGLYRMVTDLKKKNKDLKVLLSIGGTFAANSTLFSQMAGLEWKRPAFIYSAIYFIESYKFDGVDLDWYYPLVGEKLNYVKLLKELRAKCDEKGWLMTATVRYDPEGTGYDVKEMTKLLDWVHVKTYDYNGPWNDYTGHNSALYPASIENTWEKEHLNTEAAAKNWLGAGLPKNKMVLGVAFYGRSFTLEDKNQHGIHAPTDGAGPGDNTTGFIKYSEICKLKDWNAVWDNEQISIYSYHEDKWISHESKDTVFKKAAFVKQNGFLGVHVWPLDGDDIHGECGPKQILLKHVNRGLGKRVKLD